MRAVLAHREKTAPKALVALMLAATLAACGPAPAPQGFSDPYEAQNREVHETNKSIDNAILRPFAEGVGQDIPREVYQGLNNLADNLDLPGQVVNSLLQLRLGAAIENTLRFAVNSTVGLGGLFDPASAMGVPGRPTDFGETLHVWGLPEGNYVELPVVGPSTDRDTLGMIVDYAMNPTRFLIPPEAAYAPLMIRLGARLGDRAVYSETVGSVLYDSADSYAQTRLLYLQNRRFQLGQDGGDEGFVDPYEDPYAE